MRDLYGQADLDQIQGQINKRFLWIGILSLLCVGLIVFSAIRRMEWLTVAAVILWGGALIFIYDLLLKPLLSYRRLLHSALSGRTHTEVMEYARTETDESLVDGVRCLGLVFLGEPDKHGTREQLLYWDREKQLPALVEGRSMEVKYTGKMIIGLAC